MRKDLTAVFPLPLNRVYREDEDKHISELHSKRVRDNGLKIQQGKLQKNSP